MPKIFDRIREGINYLFIFTCINDNFAVDHFGGASLKIVSAAFILANIQKILSYRGMSKRNFPFTCLGVLMLLSLIVNYSTYAEGFSRAISGLVAVFAIFTILSREKEPKKYMWAFVVSALFSSYLCITSTATISEYTLRKTGGTGDPNEFSTTVLIPMFFLMGQLLSPGRLLRKMVYAAAIFIYIVALLYAGSKSAMIAFGMSFAIYIIYILRTRGRLKTKIAVCLGVGVLVCAFVYLINTYYSEYLDFVVDRFSENSTAGTRFASWQVGWSLFLDKPFLGVGIDNYANMVGMVMPSLDEAARAPHNMYLQSLTETGIVGFCVFVYSLLTLLYRLWKNRDASYDMFFAYLPLLFIGGTLSLLLEKYAWVTIALMHNEHSLSSLLPETADDENH